MNDFETWLAENFSYTSPEARESMRLGFIGGLRLAATQARPVDESLANVLEGEATRLESEGGTGGA